MQSGPVVSKLKIHSPTLAITYDYLTIFLVLELDSVPEIARIFMQGTMAQVQHESPLVTAASFTFGREDLLPHIFKRLIAQPLLAEDQRLKKFELYLDRHIELDGDCHSHVAKK